MHQVGQPIALSVPTHAAAGVSVPVKGMRLSSETLHPSGSYHGTRGLGFVDAIVGVVGSVVGGLIGAETEKKAIKAQKQIANAQIAAQQAIAELEAGTASRQIDAALSTARIQAINEMAAINSQFVTNLSAQRSQKAAADASLSAQIAANTQTGIFSLAQTGLQASAATAQAFPQAGTRAAAWIIGLTVVALAFATKRKSRGGSKGRSTKFSAGPVRFSSRSGGGGRGRFGGKKRFGGGGGGGAFGIPRGSPAGELEGVV